MKECDFKKVLIDSGIAAESDIKGLADDEIKDIEIKCDLILPGQYKNFLRACGKNAGRLGSTLTILYPGILGLKDSLQELIEDEELKILLPSNIFICSYYEGGIFDFFICDGDPNPKLFRVDDDKDGIEDRELSFLDFFFRLVATCEGTQQAASVNYSWDGEKVVVTQLYR
ncbi:MAG: SMI1/KNR4 family protein [Candidatus Thiodiazotropha sp.]